MILNEPIKTALISVSDKTGIVDFVTKLTQLGVTVYSTGGTAQLLAKHHISVKNISELTGFPEILDGRVKTLHPAVHAGLLCDRSNPEHRNTMKQQGLDTIDLVVVNLYPFEDTLKKTTNYRDSMPELIENIDIGGPTMLRSAAKNHKWTTVCCNPKHYDKIIECMQSAEKTTPLALRQQMAGEVFNHTAHYDAVIADYFNKINEIEYPETLTISFNKTQACRYGENPHQTAAIYGDFLSHFNTLHGKELSYNNIMDTSAICNLIIEFDAPTVAIVKHTNPCGVASASNFVEAYRQAFATDKEAPFGGIIAINGTLDADFAAEVHPLFAEVIIAENITPAAMEILTKKKNRRLVTANYNTIKELTGKQIRSVPGGLLMQQADASLWEQTPICVTKHQPSELDWQQMTFAWKVVKHVRSNAIVYASATRTLGIGAGQMSRVDSSRLAVEKARLSGLDLTGCAMASDAYLPFADGLLEAITAGVKCVIQPGGSVRDAEVIAEADKHNIVMCFTGQRHFKH